MPMMGNCFKKKNDPDINNNNTSQNQDQQQMEEMSHQQRVVSHNNNDRSHTRNSNSRTNNDRNKKNENRNNDSQNELDLVVSIIGLDDAGKSTAAKVLKGDAKFKETTPTVGYEPHELKHRSKEIVLYDLGGGHRVRDIWRHYLAESFGFVYVIDASNRERLAECRQVFATMIEHEKVAGKPILILANKQDQPDALDESEIVQYMNIEELVNRFQVPCRVEMCCALTGIGRSADKPMKAGFDWLMEHIDRNKDELTTRIEFDVGRQRGEEGRLRREKTDRVKTSRATASTSNYSYDNDAAMLNDEDTGVSPWTKSKSSHHHNNNNNSGNGNGSNGSQDSLSAYDRQALEQMRAPSPKQRLTTISEDMERSRQRNRFLKANNKLTPYDDRSDSDVFNKSKTNGSTSWAIVDNNHSSSGANNYGLASRDGTISNGGGFNARRGLKF